MEDFADFGLDSGSLDEVVIGCRGNDKAGRNGDFGVGHFAQIGTFAADQRNILLGNLVEPDDRFRLFLHS